MTVRVPRSVAVALAVVLASPLIAPGAAGQESDPATAASQAGQSVQVSVMLAALDVRAENTTVYNRDLFKHWVDADGNGCNTRMEVLIAESRTPVVRTGKCTIVSGSWLSYYDQVTWTAPSDVDIDHMIPLKEAWESGAHAWSADQRERFANDLGWGPSLVAVTDNVNASKGDRDPAQWMPPSATATCTYLAEWVSVKWRWGLSIDQGERDKIAGTLGSTCQGATTVVPPRTDTAGPDNLPPTDPPVDLTAIRAYVTQVYKDLFGRTPDPQGLETWTTALANGRPYGEVSNSITASREYRSGLIRGSYRTYLDRAPDPQGLETWLGAMGRGWTVQEIEAGFLASPEYYEKAGGTDAGWVRKLYGHVLGRGAAESEVAHWVDKLSTGASRRDVSMGFLMSTEHLTTVVDSYYQHLLRRNIDPSGKVTWVTKIQRGSRVEEIIASIVSSQEYRNKVN